MTSPSLASSIPASFAARKQSILKEISVPDEEYTDFSPKGSIDEGIRDLIGDVNALDGLVTTSSCAGRISVFLEGGGRKKDREGTTETSESAAQSGALDEAIGSVANANDESSDLAQQQFAATGGKGSGRWLYVSHDPMPMKFSGEDDTDMPLHKLFGLTPGNGKIDARKHASLKFIRFHWDPLILHIMCATLKHAQPVLAAASSAGFRESGLQGLRCLDDEAAHPIVAVRSAGLQLQSVIGYQEEQGDGDGSPVLRSLVSESYLQTLVAAANDRFATNTVRKERFRTKLVELCGRAAEGGKKKAKPGWEDPETRRQRKREEGMARAREKAEAAKREQSAGGSGAQANDESFDFDTYL